MSEFERILWNRNKELADEIAQLSRAMALVLISPNHEDAIKAAKEAFAKMDVTDPFKPIEVVRDTEEAEVAA